MSICALVRFDDASFLEFLQGVYLTLRARAGSKHLTLLMGVFSLRMLRLLTITAGLLVLARYTFISHWLIIHDQYNRALVDWDPRVLDKALVFGKI